MENKKYLKSDLYADVRIYNEYVEGEDNFLIGCVNNEENKIKDVITGEVRDFPEQRPLYLVEENNMAVGYMTCLKAALASPYQLYLGAKIRFMLRKDVVTAKQIKTIKNIFNTQITKSMKKEQKEKEKEKQKLEKLEQYKIDDIERNF